MAKNNFDALREQIRHLTSTDSDHDVAYRRAMRDEQDALQEYRRVLGIYTDLILRGTKPGEGPTDAK